MSILNVKSVFNKPNFNNCDILKMVKIYMKNYFKYFVLILTILLLAGCKLFSKNEDIKTTNSIIFVTNSDVKLEKMNYCVDCEDAIVELPMPQREGYIFEGWFADKELTQKVDVSSNKIKDVVWIDKETTLYAKWINENECSDRDGADSKTIKFNTVGGTEIEDAIICATCPNKTMPFIFPHKMGYIFDGWYADASYTKKVEFINNDLTNVEWTKVGCYNYQTTIYAKWINENSCKEADGVDTKTIRFDTVGGDEIETVTICATCPNKTMPLLFPHKEGYTFDGWYADASYTKKVEFKDNDLTNAEWTKVGCSNYQTTIYAKWIEENSCKEADGVGKKTIRFDTVGGDEIETITICATCPNKTMPFIFPHKMGYIFDGWYADASYTKKVEFKNNDLTNAEWTKVDCYNYQTTIYAKWIKENSCKDADGVGTKTVIFNTTGGEAIDNLKICISCPRREVVLPTPKRTGYTFDGWYADASYTKKVQGELNDISNVEWTKVGCSNYQTALYAKWVK